MFFKQCSSSIRLFACLPRCAGARGHLHSWTHGATCPLTCVRPAPLLLYERHSSFAPEPDRSRSRILKRRLRTYSAVTQHAANPGGADLSCQAGAVSSRAEAGRGRLVDAREPAQGRGAGSEEAATKLRAAVRPTAVQYSTSYRKPYRHRPPSEYRIQFSFQIELHGNASPSFAPGRQPLF
jgi:hypothetical protein